jgi:hypothetical protein
VFKEIRGILQALNNYHISGGRRENRFKVNLLLVNTRDMKGGTAIKAFQA